MKSEKSNKPILKKWIDGGRELNSQDSLAEPQVQQDRYLKSSTKFPQVVHYPIKGKYCHQIETSQPLHIANQLIDFHGL